jgi:hypothetical protein
VASSPDFGVLSLAATDPFRPRFSRTHLEPPPRTRTRHTGDEVVTSEVAVELATSMLEAAEETAELPTTAWL